MPEAIPPWKDLCMFYRCQVVDNGDGGRGEKWVRRVPAAHLPQRIFQWLRLEQAFKLKTWGLLPICKRAKQNKKLSQSPADRRVLSLPVYSELIVSVSSSTELGSLLDEINEETPLSAHLKPMARSLVPIQEKEILSSGSGNCGKFTRWWAWVSCSSLFFLYRKTCEKEWAS